MSARTDKQKAAATALFQEFASAWTVSRTLLLALGAAEKSNRGKPLFLSGMIASIPAPPEVCPAPILHAITLRNRIAEANKGLLQKFSYRNRGPHLTKEEALQCGSFGLLRAIEGFDLSRGFAFSTFAEFWVRQACQRGAVTTGHTQPANYLKHMRADERHFARTGERASAEDLGITDAALTELHTKRLFVALDDNPFQSRRMLMAYASKGSMAFRDERIRVVDTLTYDAPAADALIETQQRKTRLHAALELLPPDERAVLHQMYVLDRSKGKARIALQLTKVDFDARLASAMATLREVLSDVLEVE